MGLGLARDPRAARRHRACCCRRSGGARERHPAPIVEPAMLRVRSFGLAVGASVLFFAGFGAMLLGGRAVPHRACGTSSVLTRRPDAVPGARDGDRVQRALGAAGRARRLSPPRRGRRAAVRGGLALVHHADRRHARPTSSEYLPGMLISGAGVGLVIPTLTGAGASSLAPERFATGRGGADDGPPDRRGARRGGARGGARHGARERCATSTRRG